MRKIILSVAVSADGYIEGPNGEYDWCFTDQDYGMSAFFKRIDAVFIGRKSYEMSLGMEGMDNSWMPKVKEYVFTNTLDRVKEGAIIVKGDIRKEVDQIKQEPGKDIWLFGGASLTTSLFNEGLVDEVSMAIHPIILGAGKPLFSHINQRTPLKLIETNTYSTGLITVGYEVLKS